MKWRENEGEKVHGITPFLGAKFLYFAMKQACSSPGCDVVVGECRGRTAYGTLVIAVGAGDGAWS
jgi:hypothetical protein